MSPVQAGSAPRVQLPVASGGAAFRRLVVEVGCRPGLALLALVLTIGAGVSSVVVPLLLGRIVDVVAQQQPVSALWQLSGLLVVAALASGVLTAVANRFTDQLGVTLAAALREEALDKALRIDAATLEEAGTGDVASRVTEDVELINTSVRVASAVFTALVTVGVTVVGFASLDWRYALAFCSVFVVHAFGLRVFLPTAAQRYRLEREAAATRTQAVLNVLTGAATVHAYGMEARQTAVVDAASQNAVARAMTAARAFFTFGSTMNIAEAVGLISLITTGFFLVRGGVSTVGDVTAAALLFHRLFGPMGALLFSFNDIQQAGAALTRIVGLASMTVPEVGPPGPRVQSAGLSARGIRHAYTGGPDVLHDVAVDVPAGRSLAVVGESGAGKTTLAAVLGGVFPATGGRIRVGEREISELDPGELRCQIGVVTQDVHTFAGTLAEDLRLAVPEASEEELHAALAAVGADAWVAALPAGLDTQVGEGAHPLTAAQAQQLALARIRLVDPPVVILDEATAEAGSAGARQLEAAARAVITGRTAVVVAHRLTQAAECDQVAVMSDGRIVEVGGHEELLAAGGAYADLWAAWRK